MVALQAALMARPVVATRVGGLTEAVAHQQTGLLIENGDVHGLEEAIAFLLNDPQVATKMGMAGRERVQKYFTWQSCLDAYDVLYKKLIIGEHAGMSPLSE